MLTVSGSVPAMGVIARRHLPSRDSLLQRLAAAPESLLLSAIARFSFRSPCRAHVGLRGEGPPALVALRGLNRLKCSVLWCSPEFKPPSRLVEHEIAWGCDSRAPDAAGVRCIVCPLHRLFQACRRRSINCGLLRNLHVNAALALAWRSPRARIAACQSPWWKGRTGSRQVTPGCG